MHRSQSHRTKVSFSWFLVALVTAALSLGLTALVSHATITVSGTNITGDSSFVSLKLQGTPSGSSSLLELGPNAISGSTSGTFIGINPSLFSGDFLNFEVNSSSLFRVDSAGNVTASAVSTAQLNSSGSININAGGTNQNITLTPSGTGHVSFGSVAYPSIVPGAQAEYLAYMDGSGTTLHDQSGNGYDCTFSTGAAAPTWNSAGSGINIAAPTNGLSYLSCPAGMLAGAETVQVFFKQQFPTTDPTPASYTFLVSDSNQYGLGDVESRYGIMSITHGADAGGGQEYVAPVERLLGASDVAFVCSSPARAYINGTEASGYITTSDGLSVGDCPTFNGSGTSYIGTAEFGGTPNANFNFVGTFYSLLVYPTQLTAAQIRQNHEAVTAALKERGVDGFAGPMFPYQLIYEGDSRMEGAGASYILSQSRPYYISQLIPNAQQFTNVAVAGETAHTIDGSAHLSSVEYPVLKGSPAISKTILLDAGYNDLTSGDSAATIFGYVQDFCSYVHSISPGTKVVYSTSIPSLYLNGTTEPKWESLNNDAISAEIGGSFNCDGIDDIANDPLMATQVVPNKYNPSGAASFNSTWYTSGVHETAAANQEIASQEAFSIQAARDQINSCTVISKQVPYQVLTAANAALPSTSQAVTLLQLFPGWQVCSLSANVKTAFAGTGLTALTMSVGDSGGTTTQYLPAASLMATGTSVASQNVFTSKSGVVQMNFSATGGNLTALTAGEVDIQIGVIVRP